MADDPVITVGPGTYIVDAVKEAVVEAKKRKGTVVLEFNGDMVEVHPQSHYEDVAHLWSVKRELRQVRERVKGSLYER